MCVFIIGINIAKTDKNKELQYKKLSNRSFIPDAVLNNIFVLLGHKVELINLNILNKLILFVVLKIRL